MIKDIIFTLAFFGFPVIFFAILKFREKTILKFSFFHFVVIAIFIMQYIALLPLYFGWPGHRAFIAENNNLIIYLLIINVISLAGLLVGRILFKTILDFSRVDVFGWLNKNEQNKETSFLYIILIFSVFLILSTFITFNQLTKRGVDLASFANASSIVQLRNFSNLGYVNYLDVNIVWYFIVPFFSLAVFFAGLNNKFTFTRLFTLAPFVLLALFVAFMTFEKRPVIDIGLALLICGGYLAHKQGHLQGKKLLIIFGVGFAACAVLASVFLFPEFRISKFLTALLDRTFFGQVQSSYLYVEIFPKQHPYLAGASIPPFIYYFEPEEKVRLAKFVHEFLRLKINAAEGGSSPTIFWGQIYANFGIMPIFFAAILLGVMLEIVSLIIKAITTEATFAISYTWLGLHYTKLASTSFSTFMIDHRLYYFLVILLFLSTIPLIATKYIRNYVLIR